MTGLAAPPAASTTTTAPGRPFASRVDVPELGTVTYPLWGLDADQGSGTVVATVHGVRRVEGGTVLYYSFAVPPGVTLTSSRPLVRFSALAQGPYRGISTQMLVDVERRTAYQAPVANRNGVGTATRELPLAAWPGTSYVMYQVLPVLPDEVTEVDVVLGFGAVVPRVPVQEGLLEPAMPGESVVLTGSGWPQVDLSPLRDVEDAEAAVLPLTVITSDLEKTVTTRDEGTTANVDLATDVLFAVDSATLSAKATSQLRAAAQQIDARAAPGQVSVVGHTDSTAGDAYNLELSRRRAQAVRAALEPMITVSGVTLAASGRGESEPVADNGTAAGRQANRRVTITFGVKQ